MIHPPGLCTNVLEMKIGKPNVLVSAKDVSDTVFGVAALPRCRPPARDTNLRRPQRSRGQDASFRRQVENTSRIPVIVAGSA